MTNQNRPRLNPNGGKPKRRAASASRRSSGRGLTAGTIVRRCLLVLGTLILLAVISVFTLCAVIANGPSETIRNQLVLSATQASATKWVPGLFLSKEVVDEIVKGSQNTKTDVIPIGDYTGETKKPPESGETIDPTETGNHPPQHDEWDDAIDGMLYKTFSAPNSKVYVLLVRDPSRVYVGVSGDFYNSSTTGKRVFDMVAQEGCIACINGGEYIDNGGSGNGGQPMGLTFSKGNCVWSDGRTTNFFGLDQNNKLIVAESMTKDQALKLGIRDSVCFQTGNILITNDGSSVSLHYSPENTARSQRTAIGQRADGTLILLVTDGRTASSLGATHDEVIDMMVSLGAITAGMLDGGSSTMLYYENYYTKYNIDTTYLDTYQLQGLCNKYKAFTKPRRIPTYFCVAPLS